MKPGDCQHESEILAGVRSGRWSSELRSHLESCPACAEAAMVAEVLQQELQHDSGTTLPSAGQVWWRAQIRSRRLDAEHATRPVRVVQTIAAAFAVSGLVWLLLRYGPQLQQWLIQLPEAAENQGQPLAWIFLGTAAMFVAAVSAGLGYMRRSSK